MIASPLLGTYEISVSAAAYLTTVSQSFSLIIGSAGLTYTSQSTASSYTVCGSNQQLVYMTAMDHGGDGWGVGNSYVVLKADGTTVASGTMSGAVNDDFMKQMSMCLDNGEYTVNLVRNGAGDDEMGFEIDNQVYLSQHQTTGSFTVPATTCATSTIYLTLVGSLYGVPYGWNGDSKYELEQTKGGNLEYSGTLVTGMVRDHVYCLPDGSYELTMDDIPKNDDFFDDNYMAGYFGVEEYYISAYITGSSEAVSIDKSLKYVFTLENGVLTESNVVKNKDNGDDDDDELTAGGAAAIALAIIFIIAAVLCCGLCYWNSKRKQANSLASQQEISLKA